MDRQIAEFVGEGWVKSLRNGVSINIFKRSRVEEVDVTPTVELYGDLNLLTQRSIGGSVPGL